MRTLAFSPEMSVHLCLLQSGMSKISFRVPWRHLKKSRNCKNFKRDQWVTSSCSLHVGYEPFFEIAECRRASHFELSQVFRLPSRPERKRYSPLESYTSGSVLHQSRLLSISFRCFRCFSFDEERALGRMVWVLPYTFWAGYFRNLRARKCE